MVDLLAEHGIVPPALWTYAACGRLDLVQACFDADGRLRPDAAASRPNPADFFPIPPRIPATDDPEEIMAEAFVYACQHGRTEVVRWFLDRGQNPDVAPFLGLTGLHLAIIQQQVEVVRLLMERGADPSIRGELVPFDAAGLLGIFSAVDGRDPVIRQLRKLISPDRAELPLRVPSRRSPSVDRTTGAVHPGPPPATAAGSTPVDNRTGDRLLHWFPRLRIRRESATRSTRPGSPLAATHADPGRGRELPEVLRSQCRSSAWLTGRAADR